MTQALYLSLISYNIAQTGNAYAKKKFMYIGKLRKSNG